ncbi:ABC transporter permease [Anaerobium acetethylicum]|uniref:Putative ABC transport system permease protein n=1 Tax=Anaerobium acetethylicum TaxID=1619234 RepID=A0A1D3TU18_9FIRM|nr:ABC transporter permease [Anaerobium acetethylicum]SCP97528.1 putative ABC transport system permease protein [Anaerobium acetethylicum]
MRQYNKKALRKDFYMEIKKSFHRFASILLIVALGVAFFSGIRATKPDMWLSADEYYDDSSLMDIRVLGGLGITQEDVEAISRVKGVKAVMPAYSADMLCDTEDSQLVVKLMSAPDGINKIAVSEGRLPDKPSECLADTAFLELTGYRVGDRITVQSGNEDPVGDTLNVTEFKITGAGSTSYYLSRERGTSAIGSGTVDSFLIVQPEAFSLEVFTEAYVSVEGTAELTSYTEAYQDRVKETADAIEKIADARCELRYAEVLGEADEKIAEGEAEIAKGEKELSDAKTELDEAGVKIVDGRRQLAENEKKVSDAEAEIAANEAKLADGRKKIEDGFAQIKSGKAEIEAQRATLESGKTELASRKAELETGRAQLEANRTTLAASKAELEASKQQLAYLQSLFDGGDTSVADQIAALTAGIDAGTAQIAAAEAQIAEAEAQIEAGSQQVAAAEAELGAGESQIAQAERELAASEAELNRQLSVLESGESELAEGKKEVEAGRASLETAKTDFAASEAEYYKGIVEYEDAKVKADAEIADAKRKMEDAKEALTELEIPEWYVLDRETLQTYVEYGQDSDRIGAIGKVFPAIFFLVAALVSLTTMTRMVEEERVQIGTLKALGYNKLEIAQKYILYAVLASLGGSILGFVTGQLVLPKVIIGAYSIMYNNLPKILTPISLYYSATSTILAVVCTTLATVYACYKELMSCPAQLMRPAAPKSGKRVFLEKFDFIWGKLNFTQKATIRNLLRYKKRFFMTVFGIGGCMSLLVVGFGIRDSIMSIGDIQFGEIRTCDATVGLDENATEEEKKGVFELLEKDGKVKDQMYAREINMDAGYGKNERNVYLFIPETVEKLGTYVSLRERISREQLVLGDDGVIITEKLAKLLEAEEGDTIYIKDSEENRVEVKVTGITENYFMHYIYMSPALFENVYGETPVYNEIMTNNTADDAAFEKKFHKDYNGLDAVSSVTFTSETAVSVADMLTTMDTVIYVLVVAAGLLAFVVLYNLNNINISERQRELATLKVLGFYDGEVAKYVYRENTLLTIIGAALGILLGLILHRFIIVTAEVDIMMFGRNVEVMSYALSTVLTFFFSTFVNFTMYYKLKKINMIESLKSVE